jgi:diguanylate cyclase (GGDEF)-like protein
MGTRYSLGANRIILGSDAECDIRIDGPMVSPRHAAIHLRESGYWVTDLNSQHGTQIDEVRIVERELQDGDCLHIGRTIFRFLCGSDVEAVYHEEIYRLTITDALTGLHNRRYMNEFLERELASAVRHSRPLSFLLCDVDRLKAINDVHGLRAGDSVLREIASVLKLLQTKEELFVRYGGEEFAVVLPDATRDDALTFAELIRRTVEQHAFVFNGPIAVRISIGVALSNGPEPLTPTDLLRRAEENLHTAKSTGRNRVVG